MTDAPAYEVLAKAFVAEGVKANFALMGDANMHWVTMMSEHEGMLTIHARHEHCVCGMAMGYAMTTGDVGVASVTLGPGVTQIMTALTWAAKASVPLLVFAGEMPVNPENPKWNNQGFDQGPMVRSSGAHYVAPHSMGRLLPAVQEAFYRARFNRQPVVLGIPFDLQKQKYTPKRAYVPSSAVIPNIRPIPPNPEVVDEVVARIREADFPIVLAGRGAMHADAVTLTEKLAERSGALLATTLPGRGMFDHSPFTLGISGGFSDAGAREQLQKSDLVIAVGASLTSYTSDGGSLFPDAFVVQIDPRPAGLKDGLPAADLYMAADAKLSAEAILAKLDEQPRTKASLQTPDVAKRIKEMAIDRREFQISPDVVDPREIVAELDKVIPKDWDLVCGSGHSAYFHTHMRGRKPENYHAVREFGAIGNGISFAMGVAAARNDGKTVLVDGDGSLLMHIQELETIQRLGLKLLICILNDGAYGAEIHKLRADGLDDSGAVFGRTDLASISKGFGLRGATIKSLGQLDAIFEAYRDQDTAEIWNIHISDQVTSPQMDKITSKGLTTS